MSADEVPTVPAVAPLVDQPFDVANVVALRATVAAHADALGMPAGRIKELVLVVHELASNAIRHGGGRGRLRIWATAETAVHCQVSDDGPGIASHHTGNRSQPALDATGGRGIWLVRSLCERVTWTTGRSGTVVTATLLLTPRRGGPAPGR